jgi:hypothetical protein
LINKEALRIWWTSCIPDQSARQSPRSIWAFFLEPLDLLSNRFIIDCRPAGHADRHANSLLQVYSGRCDIFLLPAIPSSADAALDFFFWNLASTSPLLGTRWTKRVLPRHLLLLSFKYFFHFTMRIGFYVDLVLGGATKNFLVLTGALPFNRDTTYSSWV